MNEHHYVRILCWSIALFFSLSLNAQHTMPVADEASPDGCAFDEIQDHMKILDPTYARQLHTLKHHAIPQILANAKDNGRGPNTFFIPVVVHVIHQGENIGEGQNISEQQIREQIETLNEEFSATNADFDATPDRWKDAVGNPDIQFCLATIDPEGNPTNGITRHQMDEVSRDNIENNIKPATYWNTNLYYNVWVLAIPGTTNGGGVAGYAYFPTNGIIGSPRDGTVCDYRWFRAGSSVLTHELGHGLGLPHTFDGNSCSEDDGFEDTPNQGVNTNDAGVSVNCNNGYPTGPSTCGVEHMYINYMDYSPGRCKTSFTKDQITVMRAVLDGTAGQYGFGSRQQLTQNVVAVCSFFENDAAAIEMTAPSGIVCADDPTINPELTVTNFGFNPMTSLTIRYRVDNGPEVETDWTGLLQPGETSRIPLTPLATPVPGSYQLTVYTTLPNGETDEQLTNDTTIITFNSVESVPFLTISENFESGVFNPTPSEMFIINPDLDFFRWETVEWEDNYFMGTNSVQFNNYRAENESTDRDGRVDYLATKIYDFSNLTELQLVFDVAYAQYDDGNEVRSDELAIMASTDCGATFSQVAWSKSGATLATAPPTSRKFIPDDASEWRTELVDLSQYAGQSSILLAFVNTSGLGNVVYLDNINFTALKLDVGVTQINYPAGLTCVGPAGMAPEIRVTNFGIDPVNSLTLRYEVDGGAFIEDNWTGTLNPGTSVDIVLSAVPKPAPGDHEIRVYTLSPNGSPDEQQVNDVQEIGFFTIATETFQPIVEDFESVQFGPTASGLRVINVDEDRYTWRRRDAVSAFGIGLGSMILDNYLEADQPGTRGGDIDYLATKNFDFQNITGARMTFDLSYAQYTGATGVRSDTLMVLVSTDCGENFDQVAYMKTGNDLQTAPAPTNARYVPFPFANYWRTETVDLSAYNGEPNVMIALANISNMANSIYIDNINITADDQCSLVIQETHQDEQCLNTCNGSININVLEGVAPYTYQWNDAADFQTTSSIDGLCSGLFEVTVTEAEGCSQVTAVRLFEGLQVEVEVTTTPADCGQSNGTAKATASGGIDIFGYVYDWDIDPPQFLDTVSNLSPGTYMVTVFDLNGCSAVGTAVIGTVGGVDISTSATAATCGSTADGTATVTLEGGANPNDFTIEWSDDNSQSGTTATGLEPGTYTVSVTDAQGCTSTSSVEVTGPSAIALGISGDNLVCAGDANASATVVPSGGTVAGDYSYQWDDDDLQTTATAVNLPEGTYIVVVTDDNGCTATESITVTAPDPIELDANGDNVSCNGAANGTATVIPSGGTVLGDYSYQWDDGDTQTTATATGLGPNIYTVVVTDDNGCSESIAVSINEPIAITGNASSTDPTCANEQTGTAVVTVQGGTIADDYSYQWDDINMQTSATATGLVAGTYTVIVTDDNGCSITRTVQLDDPEAIDLTLDKTDVSCNGEASGTATVYAVGGTAVNDYTYAWSGGSNPTEATVINLAVGTYFVTVTDDNDCSVIESITIEEPTELTASILTLENPNCNGEIGSATAVGDGGTAPYTYLWSNGTPNATINEAAGTYTCEIRDANGCITTVEAIIEEPEILASVINTTDETGVGANDGTASADPSGGTAPFTYEWSNMASGPSVDNLAPGDYEVTITDQNGCEIIETFTINGFSCAGYSLNIDGTNILCRGEANGTATVTPEGGEGPYTYNWSGGTNPTASTVIDLIAQEYTVTVTDNSGCSLVQSITITEPTTGIELLATAVDESFAGLGDGSASATATGGTGDLSYEWSTMETTPLINNLMPGDYTVVVTDENGCTVSETVTVGTGVDCSALALNLTSTNITCFGFDDGIASVDPMGGVGPYTIIWDGDIESNSISNLAPATYGVTVTATDGCSLEGEVTITEPNAIELLTSKTDETAAGLNDGSASALASGGTGDLSYRWSTMETTPTINDLAPGIYMVTVTDENGCSVVDEVEIVAGDVDCTSLSGTISIQQGISCAGAADGVLVADGSGGNGSLSYEWSSDDIGPIAMSLSAGQYTVTITDELGCETIISQELTEPAALTSMTMVTAETSAGLSDGTASVNVFGGTPIYEFEWSNMAITPSITDLAPAIYTVTVTDANGCTIVDEVEVLAGDIDCTSLAVEFSTQDALCEGSADGTATAIPSGGNGDNYTYLWSNDQETATATDLAAGDHQVTVTDELGCEVIATVSIGEPDAVDLFLTSTPESALGLEDGTATALGSGGTAPYEYEWSNMASGSMIGDLAPGIYEVTVTDANGCTNIDEIEVFPGDADCTGLEVELSGTNISCFGAGDGTATAIPSGGNGDNYTYLWSDGQETAMAVDLNPIVTHTVTVTDELGCEIVGEITLTQPDQLDVDADATAETAFGAGDGTASASGNGGTAPYTYEWSNMEVGETITDLDPNTYTVTITDANGCTDTDEVIVLAGDIDCSGLSLQVTTQDASCFGVNDGTATALAEGGNGTDYTYLWSNSQETATATGLNPGTHFVVVTDELGCQVEEEITIGQPDLLQVDATAMAETAFGANDGTATGMPSGGTAPYTFEWSNMEMGETITDLEPGIYTVTITDVNGCTDVDEVEVLAGDIDCTGIGVEILNTNVSCFAALDGTATAIPSGGNSDDYIYEWSNGDSTATITGLSPNTYFVIVTDELGCEAIGEVSISQPDVLTSDVNATPETSLGLNDGTATANVMGGTAPYDYEWSNMETGASITDLMPGIYNVTITDANGCSVEDEVEVSEGQVDCSSLSVSIVSTNVSCNGEATGTATAEVVGGNGDDYIYRWSDDQVTPTAVGLVAGIYSVVITDELGCQVIGQVEITQPNEIEPNVAVTDESSFGLNDGAAASSPNGGVAPYEFEWSTGAMTAEINDQMPGIYFLTITDANGCITVEEVIIGAGPVDCTGFDVEIDQTGIACFGNAEGSITAMASGGTGDYTYSWSNGMNGPVLNNLLAGEYILTVVDGLGCEIIQVVDLLSPQAALELETTPTNETTFGAQDGTASAVASGGTPPYTYEWSNMETGPFINNLAPGPYIVTVTDNNGCETIQTVIIEPGEVDCSSFAAGVQTSDATCFGLADGSAQAQVNGGFDPYEYNWSNGMSGPTISGVPAGDYTLIVVDDRGCVETIEFTIGSPSAFVLNMVGVDGDCGDNASASANISGGTAPYQYAWSNGATDRTITDIDAGNYSVTITDNNGCTTSGNVSVTINTGGVDVDAVAQNVSCFGSSDGVIDLDVLNGTPPFEIEWSNGDTTASIDNLEPGAYTVFITDADGCSYLATYQVNSPAEISVAFGINYPTSPTANDGEAIANVNGGTSPYSYLWDNGTTGIINSGLGIGTYFVTITDANNCVKVDSVSLDPLTSVFSLETLTRFELFPNPSTGQLKLMAEFNRTENVEVTVYNVIGREVYRLADSGRELNIDLNLTSQPSGTYLVSLRTKDGQIVRKLLLIEP
ncbi:MAG: T9SS type A sorting domain-containing protein [Bacteroidota bacterium]